MARACLLRGRQGPNQTKQDRRRIKELERDLRRKNAALAETTALLVLSKKLEAIFHKDKGEDGDRPGRSPNAGPRHQRSPPLRRATETGLWS